MALAGGEAIGRWGCFFGECCYRKIATHLPWAVYEHGAYRHPTQAYLALAATAVFLVLWQLHTKPLPENALFYIQGTLSARLALSLNSSEKGRRDRRPALAHTPASRAWRFSGTS